jgi:hypothetical protein
MRRDFRHRLAKLETESGTGAQLLPNFLVHFVDSQSNHSQITLNTRRRSGEVTANRQNRLMPRFEAWMGKNYQCRLMIAFDFVPVL